jgi:hypothetical protein
MMNAEEVVQVTQIPDEVQRWTAKRKVAVGAMAAATVSCR